MKPFAVPPPILSASTLHSHKDTVSLHFPSSAYAGSLVLRPASPRRCAKSLRPDRVAPTPRGGSGLRGQGLARRHSGQGVCPAAADAEQRQLPSTH